MSKAQTQRVVGSGVVDISSNLFILIVLRSVWLAFAFLVFSVLLAHLTYLT